MNEGQLTEKEQIFQAEVEKKKGQIVVGVIENSQGQLLLILRKKDNFWAFPSGVGATYKYGETPDQAIHSEVAYDTKLKIENAKQIMRKPIEGDKKAESMIAYVCKAREGQKVELNEDSALDYAWVNLDDPRLDNLPFDQPEVIEVYRKILSSNVE